MNIWGRWAVLALLMTATRYYHFGSQWHLPDASLAVFFLGGWYLQRLGWAFLLMCQAALLDYLAISSGVSAFCISPTYGFLVPAYLAAWFGGRYLTAGNNGFDNSNALAVFYGVLRVIAAWCLSVSVAFFISNGSFYWLSGRFPQANMAQYFDRVIQYYPSYLLSPVIYIVAALLLHFTVKQLLAVTLQQEQN